MHQPAVLPQEGPQRAARPRRIQRQSPIGSRASFASNGIPYGTPALAGHRNGCEMAHRSLEGLR
jgi:hypothetical protein